MVQQAKINKVNELKQIITDNPHLVFTDYRGLDVSEINRLRKSLHGIGTSFFVTKNTFLQIVLKEYQDKNINDILQGPTAIAYSKEFPSEAAKFLKKFAKENDALDIKGALIEGEVYDAQKVEDIANMPSRQELVGRLAYVLNSPIQGLAQSLNGILMKFFHVLKAIEDKKTS
jgi:large subunit ribosomal protein L10